MPETRAITRLLRRIRQRVRANVVLQEITDAAIRLLAIGVVVLLWNRTMPLAWALPWPVLALGVIGVGVHAAVRLARREPLWKSAAQADRAAALHDELTSAYWFSRHPEESEWVDMHLERASTRAGGLDAATLVRLERPRRVGVIAVLVTGLVIFTLAPVPRVFDRVVERLAAIDLGGSEPDRAPVSELQEATADELEAEPGDRAEQERATPQLHEQQQEGQEALPEDGAEEGAEEPDPEGQQMEGDEQGEQGEAGEENQGQQMDVDNPEDVPAESEGEPAPDPNASQQQGEGESTEESGDMLPGGEEVFLQEGGEDLEQKELAEEDLGHATREGGMEQDLDLGELSTLQVELEREILAVPEQEEEDPTEEEKEEEITRAERSFLQFEAVDQPGDFARQELLESEPIPWRYRQMVLNYFKALRERDNQKREEQR